MSAPPQDRIPPEAYDLLDPDLGSCPYLARWLGLPGHDPEGSCERPVGRGSACWDEPECVTGAPREGWPSLTGYTPELLALWRDLGGGDA